MNCIEKGIKKKSYFRCLAFLLILGMLLQPAAGSAAGTAGGQWQNGTLELIQDGRLAAAQTGPERRMALRGLSEERSDARETVYKGLLAVEPTIDLEKYRLTVEKFKTLLGDIINSSPELFYVAKKFRYQVSAGKEKYVLSYTPSYQFGGTDVSEARIEEMKALFHNVSDQILSGVNPEWSDVEKALYIHDYLVSHYEYDTRDVQSETNPCHYDAYSLIVEGRAVCEGYALAYLYFMKRLGIPCRTVPSDAMRHMWNQVQLGGQWYHVDVTWDDPLDDMPGRAEHKYFLKSDSVWKASYVWDDTLSEPCEDTSKDSFFWESSSSPLVSDGKNWFCVKNKSSYPGIYRWDPEADPGAERLEKLADISTYRWETAVPGYYFTEKYVKLAIHQGILYYNTPNEVLCIQADSEGLTKGESVPGFDLEAGRQLYGLWIRGRELQVVPGTVSTELIDGQRVSVVKALEPETVLQFETPEPTYPPRPLETEPPRKTAAPDPTNPPEKTMSPDPTNPPEKTIAPDPTNPPEKTIAPDPANPPEKTIAPDITNPPETGERPGTSASPSQTPAPVLTAPPAQPGDPVNTSSPSVPSSPSGDGISSPSAPQQMGPGDSIITQVQDTGGEKTEVLSRIRISAGRGKKKIVVTVPKGSKVVLGINKKILLNKKKRYKKLTFTSKQTKSGKLSVKTSSRLTKKMKITVTVTAAGKKYKKIKTI